MKKYIKKNTRNILIYDISYKTSTGEKPLRIRFNKVDGFIKFTTELDILCYLIIVIVIKFVIGLNVLWMKRVVLQIV